MGGYDFANRSQSEAWAWCWLASITFVVSLYLVPARLRRLPRSDPAQVTAVYAQTRTLFNQTAVPGTSCLSTCSPMGMYISDEYYLHTFALFCCTRCLEYTLDSKLRNRKRNLLFRQDLASQLCVDRIRRRQVHVQRTVANLATQGPVNRPLLVGRTCFAFCSEELTQLLCSPLLPRVSPTTSWQADQSKTHRRILYNIRDCGGDVSLGSTGERPCHLLPARERFVGAVCPKVQS